MSPRAFNRTCAAATLALILVSHLLRGPSYQDFPQYYMGGLVARAGQWDSLYPQVLPDSIYNPGWADQSIVREPYAQLARQHGVSEFGFRFIHSPPVALMFLPMTWLEYPKVYWIWCYFLAACMFLVALQAARVHVICADRETRMAGAIILIVGCSVLAYRAVRVGNVSVIVALCIGTVMLELAGRGWFAGSIALVLGALLKYATPVLVPIHLIMGRWRTLAGAAGFLLVVTLATMLFSGPGPFREFVTVIVPTLARSHPIRANQSLQGLLLRLSHHDVLPAALLVPYRAIQWATLIVIVWLIYRRRTALRLEPPVLFAAGAALVAWLLIFGPLFWEHYPVYLCPMWGWLAWEAAQRRWKLAAAAVAIAFAWVPLPALQWLTMPEPINSHILISTILILVIGLARLAQPATTRATAQAPARATSPTP
jgi:hypothetical protein